MNLSRYEQEVVINFNAEDDTAVIYSANPVWCRKLDALVREYPNKFRVRECSKVGRTYECPKRLIRIGKPRELSFAQRENLARMRANKGIKAENGKG